MKTQTLDLASIIALLVNCSAVIVDDNWLSYPSADDPDENNVFLSITLGSDIDDERLEFLANDNETATFTDGILILTASDGKPYDIKLLAPMVEAKPAPSVSPDIIDGLIQLARDVAKGTGDEIAGKLIHRIDTEGFNAPKPDPVRDAAPDMLIVLRQLMERRDKCFIPSEDGWDERARAALSKAQA